MNLIAACLLTSFTNSGFQNSVPPLVTTHVNNLQSAKGLKVELSVLKLSGGVEKISLLFAKPNLYRIESPSALRIGDGSISVSLDKKKNTYSKGAAVLPMDAETWALDPETWAWGAFFTPDVLKATSGWQAKGKRQIRGAMLDEVVFKFPGGDSGSLFIDPANGIAKGYSRTGKVETIIIATNVTAMKEAPDAKEFVFTAGTAKKEEPKPMVAEVLYAEVAPIFQSRCLGCHNSGNAKGGYAMDDLQSVLKGGRAGAAVKPGDPDGSILVQYIKGTKTPRMPKSGGPLTDAEIQKISDWVGSGAK